MLKEAIVTLLAEKGQKYDETGEAIASHGRCIVFLPKGVEPGQQVRVELEEIRADRAGRMMYRGIPAPVEYSERWKDNGDGTASKVTVQTDWLGNEMVWDEGEPRKLETRDGTPRTRTERSVVWGSSPTNSFVEEVEVKTIPIEGEVIRDGALAWEKTSEREERGQTVRWSVDRVLDIGPHWNHDRFQVTYDPSWSPDLRAYYQVAGEEKYITESVTWGEVPGWLQAEIESRCPVCSCGRQRHDAQVPDGYDKCELCRAEETCERCGKQAKVAVINGRLVCDACQPYETAEQLIRQHLTDAHRQAIADEAKKLLSGHPLEAELGLMVLKVGLGHVSSDYTRDRILNRWQGYRWYYFTDEGVFGTKLDPAALEVLQYLPMATGNSLVELVAWVTGARKAPSSFNFYLATQVEGQEGDITRLTDDFAEVIARKLDEGIPVLADRLRGPESERLAALEAFRRANEEIGDEDPWTSVGKLLAEADAALQGGGQDYAKVIAKAEAALAERDRQKVLEDLLAQEYAVCPVCGGEWNFREEGAHYCERQAELRARGQYQDFTVKESRVGNILLVELKAVYYDDRYRDYELKLVVNDEIIAGDPDAVETETFWWEPSERERELAEQLAQLRAQLEPIEYERERPASRVEGTFKAVEHRGKTQLQFEGTFTGSVENRKATDGSGYSSYDNQPAKFVCKHNCHWLDEEPKVGERWICTTAFQIAFSGGRVVIVVNPQVRVGDEAQIRAEIACLEAELAAEAVKVEPFDENDEANTVMAAAFREAGLA